MFYKPFLQLKELLLLKEKDSPQKPLSCKPIACQETYSLKDDKTMFQEAMADVIPLEDTGCCVISHCNRQIKHQNILPKDPEYEAKAELKALVQGKGNFRIADTPEYMEGLAPGVPHWVATKLHNRFFSYQDYIDLHGLCVEAAYDAFNGFMKASVEKGLNCVLIVHGRGKSSPDIPKLKQAVRFWLTRGIWRKWVLAFASAQIYDGGAGATYVLLSHRPLKGTRKKRRNCSGTK